MRSRNCRRKDFSGKVYSKTSGIKHEGGAACTGQGDVQAAASSQLSAWMGVREAFTMVKSGTVLSVMS